MKGFRKGVQSKKKKALVYSGLQDRQVDCRFNLFSTFYNDLNTSFGRHSEIFMTRFNAIL